MTLVPFLLPWQLGRASLALFGGFPGRKFYEYLIEPKMVVCYYVNIRESNVTYCKALEKLISLPSVVCESIKKGGNNYDKSEGNEVG